MTSTTAPTQIATIYPTSSSFSSNPTIPTSTIIGTSTSSQTATTYLLNSTYAPLASPTFTGTPTGPTASAGDVSTQLATTAFVQSAVGTPITIVQWDSISSGGNSQWNGYLPLSITMNTFSFLFYSNAQSTYESVSAGVNLSSNNTQFTGFGTASKQNYTANGNNLYGYVFSILSYTGAPSSSPNLNIATITSSGPSTLGVAFCKLSGLIDGNFYYNQAINNKLTLVITQWN
jgi:hypothetical protein